jgi:hypothetical protein
MNPVAAQALEPVPADRHRYSGDHGRATGHRLQLQPGATGQGERGRRFFRHHRIDFPPPALKPPVLLRRRRCSPSPGCRRRPRTRTSRPSPRQRSTPRPPSTTCARHGLQTRGASSPASQRHSPPAARCWCLQEMRRRLARCPALQQWQQLGQRVKQLESEMAGLKGAEKEVGVALAAGAACWACAAHQGPARPVIQLRDRPPSCQRRRRRMHGLAPPCSRVCPKRCARVPACLPACLPLRSARLRSWRRPTRSWQPPRRGWARSRPPSRRTPWRWCPGCRRAGRGGAGRGGAQRGGSCQRCCSCTAYQRALLVPDG